MTNPMSVVTWRQGYLTLKNRIDKKNKGQISFSYINCEFLWQIKIKYEISEFHVEIDAILLCFLLTSPSAVETQYIFPQAKSPGYNN